MAIAPGPTRSGRALGITICWYTDLASVQLPFALLASIESPVGFTSTPLTMLMPIPSAVRATKKATSRCTTLLSRAVKAMKIGTMPSGFIRAKVVIMKLPRMG